ncbi:hypothetical protein HII36_38100 [Nonomuraea sp. NN258]|uniref:hypothetical protein n=1 Tax=Nonomuraea antri TaxID=2730852 RepID=UPI00156922F6|nr:hypothetical protein [Nonomuraea antri]NRQ37603.1 hypothetical protein [Nonomuraea antri]
MKATRTIVIAVSAGTLFAAPATAAWADTQTSPQTSPQTSTGAASWGPKYAPGKKAVAQGALHATNLNKSTIPSTATVHVTGRITDRTSGSGCGWAVFRITYRKADGNLPFKHRSFLDCSKGSPRAFAFTDRNVAHVELKVCSEGKAKAPSNVCLYAGTWKSLYSTL